MLWYKSVSKMTVNEECAGSHTAIGNRNPIFCAASPTPITEEEEDVSDQSITTTGSSVAPASITSLHDDHLLSLNNLKMAPYIPRNDKFQSLVNTNARQNEAFPALVSLPPNPAKMPAKPSSTSFPKYKRQYKVESIYVNDLYTLTYDEDETLESIKSIVVNYVSI